MTGAFICNDHHELPVQVKRSYLRMMSFHLVENKVVRVRFDVFRYPFTRSQRHNMSISCL